MAICARRAQYWMVSGPITGEGGERRRSSTRPEGPSAPPAAFSLPAPADVGPHRKCPAPAPAIRAGADVGWVGDLGQGRAPWFVARARPRAGADRAVPAAGTPGPRRGAGGGGAARDRQDGAAGGGP